MAPFSWSAVRPAPSCWRWRRPCWRRTPPKSRASAEDLVSPLQSRAVPAAEICGCLIGRLEKLQQDLVGIACFLHSRVRQDEFAVIGAVQRPFGTDARVRETGRLRVGVGIK